MDQLLDSEDHIRQSDDRKADQRRDYRDRGDPIRLLELTKLPVGHIRLSSNCSKSQLYDPSKQTPEEGCYAEEHKHGHHQQTRSPTGRVARLIIPRVRTEQGRRQRPCGVPPSCSRAQSSRVAASPPGRQGRSGDRPSCAEGCHPPGVLGQAAHEASDHRRRVKSSLQMPTGDSRASLSSASNDGRRAPTPIYLDLTPDDHVQAVARLTELRRPKVPRTETVSSAGR